MRLQNVSLLGCILLLSLICNDIVRSAAESSLLGVAPGDENYYKAGTIKCKDGSKKFTKSQLNDDFCDCPDGSDEPGTSACPNGKFYCKNAGHAPLTIYSSRVNDGICDCCDGSDEYDGKIKCQNTCWEAGKVARDKLKKKIATYQEGVTIRNQEIEQAKLSIAKEQAELSKLKDEEKILKGLVQQLKERKEEIDRIEEKERLQKEKEEKERMEAEAAKKKAMEPAEKPEDTEHEAKDINDESEIVHQPPQDSEEGHQDSDSETEIHNHLTEEELPDQEVEEVKEDTLQDFEVGHPESDHEPDIHDHSVFDELPDQKGEEVKEDALQNSELSGEHSSIDSKTGTDTDTAHQEKNADEDTESLSREELGRRIASRWTGENVEQQAHEEDTSVDADNQYSDEIASETNDEEYSGYDSEDDNHKYDDDHKYDHDNDEHTDDFDADDSYDSSSSHKIESDDELDLSDTTGSSGSSWLEKIQNTVTGIFRAANIFHTPVNVTDAAQIRKEYDESSAKLSKLQSRISSLTKKLKQDFGPEKQFYSFYGQCFEGKENKYVYKVCPFKQATQEEGHSTTRLGNWEKFEESYRVMQFLNGDKCWNGPDRSLTVRLRCGLKSEVADVDEPSRCEYVALLATPALCVESKLKELENKLESLNKEQPEGHDEL